ncbi:MAG: aldo/keto reductase, partial [Lachnospiraceae bacterium]|nr:aldo/keto reductase [Lachnospiraceae bacterium]
MKKLGFGFMRLPHLADGTIDMELVKQMVDMFMENGFCYFDTAYKYCGGLSEPALREALVDRYPRDSYILTT